MRSRLRSVILITAVLASVTAVSVATTHTPDVLRVGTYHGIPGTFTSVQAAVRAAEPGDWVLVGPGDYKEEGFDGMDEPAGVLIQTPWLHLRGMNRNAVIIDGTKPGAPACSGAKEDQIFTKDGMNGVVAFKVDGVYIENLTTCNYLTGSSGGEGNEIWWNGGDGSGKIGMGPYWGNYITATSTYSNGVHHPRGEYGIFVSNAKGPGAIDHTYASNMGDAAYYIGACPDCNAVLTHSQGEFSALGFSGTNAGGHLIIENNEFDYNKTGAAPDSQNNDDAPSPNDGACPNPNEISSVGTNSCTIWRNNYFHDNNNPNVPGSGDGLAGAAPVGSGLVLAGTRNVTVIDNRFERNGSWGVLVADLPDQEDPPTDIGQNCQGGIAVAPTGTPGGALCYFQAFGNDVRDNSFVGNGFYKNPSNGDIGLVTTLHNPGNCFSGNTDPAGLTADPPAIVLQSDLYACDRPNGGETGVLLAQALCATQLVAPCPDLPIAHYPRATQVTLTMSPKQPTMPNPCKGVPQNPWCPRNKPSAAGGPARAGVAATAIGGIVFATPKRRRLLP
ncbi:MAG: hypothetical protein ACXVEX_03900 [Actinomycetota bacterium]